jgi:hypothetical protein
MNTPSTVTQRMIHTKLYPIILVSKAEHVNVLARLCRVLDFLKIFVAAHFG